MIRGTPFRVLLASALFLGGNAFVPRSLTKEFTIYTPSKQNVLAKVPSVIDCRGNVAVGSSTTALAASGAELVGDPSLSHSLTKLLLETMIVNGVPALFTILVIAFAAFQLRPGQDEEEDDGIASGRFGKKNPAAELYSDLYGGDESNKPMSPFQFFDMFKPPQSPASANRGIPDLQYITIKNLNQKYDSYEYSLTSATQSKAKAAALYRAKNFDRALKLSLNTGEQSTQISPSTKTTLLKLEKEFLKSGSILLNKIQEIQTELTKSAIDEKIGDMGIDVYQLDPPETNVTSDNTASSDKKSGSTGKKSSKSSETAFSALATAQKELTKLELDFVTDVVETMGSERASGIRAALLGDIAARGSGGLLMQLKDRPLSALLQSQLSGDGSEATHAGRQKSLFVTQFPGDVQASQVAELREEVTAIVRNAKPGDEALVVLQSGGGTVTGYGLAAAQLMRFKDAGLKLTIAVEQVAASGGYMMCCVADKIVSSPFAVLGSIGVISDIPNVYERLKKEGIEFQTVTAGKYKRTVTPTKRVTKEDFAKTKEDVEQILVLFKKFVHQNRPSLDIDAVATGETWFGEDALERGLIDKIQTADDILSEYVDGGWDVYEVQYTPPGKKGLALGQGLPGTSTNGVVDYAIQSLVKTAVQAVKTEMGSGISDASQIPLEKRYMMVDDSAERMRSEHK